MSKKVIVTRFINYETENANPERPILVAHGTDDMEASDGYHTFTELYDHRITLYIALCKMLSFADNDKAKILDEEIWRSKLHADGSSFEGWFVLGIGKGKGKQVTYHLPLNRWDEVSFAETLERGPEWDGHTPTDVLGRLTLL